MTDDAAFGRDLAALYPSLGAYARNLCRDAHLAEDVVQDTMAKAWAARDRFAEGTNLKAWTYTILRNLFLSRMRRTKWDGGSTEDLAGGALPVAAGGPEMALHVDDMLRGLALVPTDQREALLLVAMGATYEEAAEELVTSVGTVKSRVARGRLALEEALA